ncbi:hypothetical protein ATE47_04930 [Chryseobacterium sp. IHB B 17019]|jgi:hypothetical protein|uniref:hypothetical protein n=1 Tax=Chryseobacterium sp. IHB B 17019 TaxID=1721091 RepID=UPI00072165B2|nr:hypothetical protein [Chryseobacterium sp. IHB B 17019]ALR29907.1 hypothetical protein ATE47_04930 [Chryseobacterium sp. IHB B 17019]
MKKTLLTLCLLGTIVVSAFPFRTSCGKVVNVSEGITFHTDDTLQEALAGLDRFLCNSNTHASQIVIYGH